MKRLFPLIVLWAFCLMFQTNTLSAQSSHCDSFDINLKANGIICGDTHGGIWLDIIGGKTGIYEISWCSFNNRVEGKATSFASNYEITSLPEGTYTVKVTDYRTRCSSTKKVEIKKGALPQGVEVKAKSTNCKGLGNISMSIPGFKKPPFNIHLKGPQSNNYAVYTNSFKIYNLPAGDYEISLVEEGCTASTTINIPTTPGLPSFTLVDEKDECGVSSGNVTMNVTDGVAGYRVTIDGPTSGSVNVTESDFRIFDLKSGAYKITLEDANGCLAFGSIEIDRAALSAEVAATHAKCDQNGAINVAISKGKAPYKVNYKGGGIEGSKDVVGSATTLSLPVGTYDIEVVDASGCNYMAHSSILLQETNLYCSITPSQTTCNESNGSMHVFISGGTKPFTFSYTGPISGTKVVDGTFSLDHLPAGFYATSIHDADGCSVAENAEVVAGTCSFIAPQGSSSAAANLGFSEELSGLQVQQNYPNPFVNQTNLLFSLPEAGSTTIMIHDYTGKVVQTHTANYDKGANLFTFNQNNLAAGVYYYTIQAGIFRATKKMIIR